MKSMIRITSAALSVLRVSVIGLSLVFACDNTVRGQTSSQPLGKASGQLAMRAAAPPLLEVLTQSDRHVGLPIHWDDSLALLLEPSGRMIYVNAKEVAEHRVLEEAFAPQTVNEARSALVAEFGPGFETATVGPYVILSKQGTAQRWRERFRTLVGGYFQYFEVRGWQLRNPDFPLCVIVLPSRADFDRYCLRETGKSMPNLLGYYFPKNNRCVLYEVPQAAGSVDWSETERTIVHEAVHQLAYNTGIHERLAANPLWVVEGLATMLEERRILESRSSTQLTARINPQQLTGIRPILNDPAQLQTKLSSLVRSDELFKSDPQSAYALAWALTFYLNERMPNQFNAYTQQVAKIPKLQEYAEADRQRDFNRVFEGDMSLLAVQIQKFYGKLKQE
ncbi:MAG: DUF1570 domain-containing protein [Pirellulales bacterium]